MLLARGIYLIDQYLVFVNDLYGFSKIERCPIYLTKYSPPSFPLSVGCERPAPYSCSCLGSKENFLLKNWRVLHYESDVLQRLVGWLLNPKEGQPTTPNPPSLFLNSCTGLNRLIFKGSMMNVKVQSLSFRRYL